MRFLKPFLIFIIGFALYIPNAHAALSSSFEVSGWIPYWRSATGTQEFLAHMDEFKEINPFAITVTADGRLKDQMNLTAAPWPQIQQLAKAKQIRVIPTVMWSDGNAIDKVLRNPVLRQAHIADIVAFVKNNNFDGIDIDYEAKLSDTQAYYSQFLKELYKAMGNKWVECEVEARTPEAERLAATSDDPKDYANDYKAIAKYCDRVRIMAYDQASVDQKLTSITQGPYIPVADPRWVTAVLQNAMKTIPKSKITLGVATYGYEYKVTPVGTGYNYKLQWAFNPKYATDLAAQLGIAPTRNIAGELSFIYHPQNVTAATNVNSASAFGALAQATDSSFNILWWSDAQAVNDKIKLAKSLGLRGVSVFKIDGGADPALWTVLP